MHIFCQIFKGFKPLFLCVCALFLVSCNQKEVNYIDYIKVSDETYLGVSEVATNLDVPWDIQFSPSLNSLFVTEIKGGISIIDLETGEKKEIFYIPNVYHKRTLGLLGMVLHPDFQNKPFIYVAYTTKNDEKISSELAKLTFKNDTIVHSEILLRIDGATGHNGSRLVFDQDNYLYWATGDAHSKTHSQDSTTLNGKILRMTDEGKIPNDNPISGSYVYAWGFRNIQGLTFTGNGNLMSSEHGDAIEDEVNWVRPLHNFGWIDIEGYHDTPKEIEIASKNSRTEPIKAWTPVIAPAGMKYYGNTKIPEWNNSLLLTTLKSQSLRVLKLNHRQSAVKDEEIFLKDHYGRLRAVTTDNKGNVYIATSNRDWNPQAGFPLKDDDRILKLSKIDFIPDRFLSTVKPIASDQVLSGKQLYQSYCASCHKENGLGIEGNTPPLANTETVKSEAKLLQVVLNGLTEEIVVKGIKYNQPMPSFHFLTDDELAKILTYVRSNFGNAFQAIDAKKVSSFRKNN